MVITSGLKRVCDISFFMTFATLIAWLFGPGGEPGLIITLPIFIGSSFLASFLAKWGIVRFLVIFPLLTVFLLVQPTRINLFVLVIAIVLLLINLPKPNEDKFKNDYHRVFGYLRCY